MLGNLPSRPTHVPKSSGFLQKEPFCACLRTRSVHSSRFWRETDKLKHERISQYIGSASPILNPSTGHNPKSVPSISHSNKLFNETSF
jgi:hypothetical protein